MKKIFTSKKRIIAYSAFAILLFPAVALPVAGKIDGHPKCNDSSQKLREIAINNDENLQGNSRLIFKGENFIKLAEGESINPAAPLLNNLMTEDGGYTYTPLYFNDFTTQEDWDAMKVINANGDSETWHWNVADARVMNLDTPDTTMNDWLMTPFFTLEAGQKYKISYKARNGMSKWPERMGVYIGNDTTIEAMQHVLKEPELIIGYGWFDYEMSFIPTQTGRYVLGFHGCSDEDTYNLHIDDIAVSQYIPSGSPAAVASMKVTPDVNYDTKATIEVTVPTLDLAGSELKDKLYVVLTRNDVRVDTIENVAPGATCSFTDIPAAPGVVTYVVRVGNSVGEGPITSKTQFVGVNLPANVESITYTENGNTGEVTATWTPVTTDTSGNTLPADKIKYAIYDYASGKRTLIADGLTGTQHTFQLVAPGQQHTKQIAIWATTAFGESLLGAGSNTTFVGTPYKQFAESFANGYLSHDIKVSVVNNYAAAGMANDGRFADYRSCDDDNGFIYLLFKAYNDAGALEFGKMSLANMEKPALSFYTYNVVGADGSQMLNEVRAEVRICGETDYKVIKRGNISNLCQSMEGWGRVTVPLDEYKGKDIEFRIVGVAKSLTLTFFDDVRVESTRAKDLKAHQITVPSKVNPGDNYKVEVIVANDGQEKASGYNVDLYCNDEKVSTIAGPDIDPAKRATVTFPLELSILEENMLNYHAVVRFDGDENISNNQTKTMSLRPLVSKLPTVTDLGVADKNNGVLLTWKEPVYQDGVPTIVNEDFEAGVPFTHTFEDWTFVDVDDSPLGAIAGAPFPGFYLNVTKASFFVIDSTNLPSFFGERFCGHSGTQYIGSMLRYDDEKTDDWAISPKLSGKKQTISFWAKRFLPNTEQMLYVYYNTTGKFNANEDIEDDFVATPIQNYLVPNTWTKIEVELPEGAQYFALRSHTKGGLLMIDDVTFERVFERNLKLQGYNLWRDGEKINNALVEKCEYTDNPADGTHIYRVTAVYDKGESAGCQAKDINVSYVSEINSGVQISTWKETIKIEASENVEVGIYDLSGRVAYSNIVSGSTIINLQSGVYILKVGTSTIKVVI